MSDAPRPLDRHTLAVTAGRPDRVPDAPLGVPVTFASTYHAGGTVEYGRYGNPTWSALEEAVATLEGVPMLAFSSGLAAVAATLAAALPDGGTVAAPHATYTGTAAQLRELARQSRVRLRGVDPVDRQALVAAAAGADLVWLEVPGNPLLEVPDLRAAADAVHATGGRLAVDATFATPLLVRPAEHGADLVVHSGTKLIAGHSDVLLGLAGSVDPVLQQRLEEHRRLHGGVAGPMEAWLALRGLRTLGVRMDRAAETARMLADRLSRHPAVLRVRDPGFGSMLAVEVRGGAAGADRVAAAVRLWVHATSLGGVESSLERRRRWESESPEVPESLLRLSVGVEDAEDLWTDLAAALDAADSAREG